MLCSFHHVQSSIDRFAASLHYRSSLHLAIEYRRTFRPRSLPFLSMSLPIVPTNAEASSSSSNSTTAASTAQTQDAHASVLMPSETIPDDATHIKGPNFDNAINLQDLLESYEKIGFQATGMAKAIQIVEQMVSPP